MKCFLLVLVCLIITRHDVDSSKYLSNENNYSYCIQLRMRDATGIVEMEASIIHSQWILTAAHGLNSVHSNQEILIHDQKHSIESIEVHPEWEGFENDVALIKLKGSIKNAKPVPLYNGSDELHKEITIMGRGVSGDGSTGPGYTDRMFRVATNRIDSVSQEWIKFRFDAPGDPYVTDLEGISGPGDSGGPAIIIEDGNPYLVGISSNQLNQQIGIEEGRYGVIEYYTRISSYRKWIDQVITGQFEATNDLTTNSFGFPETEIGSKAMVLMNAISKNAITDTLMEAVFYKDFRESFNLKGFVEGMASTMNEPRLSKLIKAKKNVLIFIVQAGEEEYYIQLDADKRDDYKIGGLLFKKYKG